jgi:outer membrane protein assembly factor BamB
MTLAVVPVFVNAGAAVLPAIMAGLTSVVALFLKPKELIRVCRQKPYIPVAVVAGGALLYGVYAWLDRPAAPAQRTRTETVGTDWVKVALDLIKAEQRAGTTPLAVPALQSASTTSPTGLYFRGGAQRSGHLGGPSPVGLTPIWEYAEPDTMYCASPLVAGDVVYGASVYLDPPGSFGTVFCLDAATGKPRWVADRKGAGRNDDFKGFFSSPALSADGQSVLIGQGLHMDTDSELVCLDARTGRVRWLIKTPLHIEGSPAVAGDIVVAGAGAVEVGDDHKPKGDPNKAGNPGFVLGVRISDGRELWRVQVNDPESSPVIADGVAYIGSGMNGNAVVALRIAPDEELRDQGQSRQVWKVPTPYPATGPVSIGEDLVLIGCGKGDFVVQAKDPEGVVLALDRQTGAVRWRTPMPDVVLGAIAVRDGKAIVPVRNGEVVALDLRANGAVLWRARVHESSPVLAAPALTGPYVYAVSQDGYLAVLDAADGRLLETVYLNAPNKPGEMGLSTSAPLIVGGRLYVGSETGGLRAFAGKETK